MKFVFVLFAIRSCLKDALRGEQMWYFYILILTWNWILGSIRLQEIKRENTRHVYFCGEATADGIWDPSIQRHHTPHTHTFHQWWVVLSSFFLCDLFIISKLHPDVTFGENGILIVITLCEMHTPYGIHQHRYHWYRQTSSLGDLISLEKVCGSPCRTSQNKEKEKRSDEKTVKTRILCVHTHRLWFFVVVSYVSPNRRWVGGNVSACYVATMKLQSRVIKTFQSAQKALTHI